MHGLAKPVGFTKWTGNVVENGQADANTSGRNGWNMLGRMRMRQSEVTLPIYMCIVVSYSRPSHTRSLGARELVPTVTSIF